MSVIIGSMTLPALIAGGFSLDDALWVGAASFMMTSVRAPVRRSGSMTALAFTTSLVLTSLALVAA